MELETLRELASIAVNSGLSSDSVDATLARMLILDAIGAHPMASLKDLLICDGQPCISPALIGATIMRSNRYRYVISSATSNGASVEIHEADRCLGMESYGREHSMRDGSAGDPLHQTLPHMHYFGRALANAARLYLPHLFHSYVTLPDEHGMLAHYSPLHGWNYTAKDAA